ncbi:MAG: ATP-grasp domain-containing protein [Acidobacteria bacterium]|nr:ATP-grasp domain-containing protein [Acidobacteriota bacterium]
MPEKLLIANRGEIAVRIMRACRDLGLETVAVFSEADRSALHVRHADYAIAVGPPPARESYLVPERLLAAARATGARYVHPGFGFLSENADFAKAVIDAGLVWVGPDPSSIAAMGSKTESRKRMIEAGVPVVPGMTTPAKDAEEIRAFGRANGFPLLLKAAAGGGGKGMRVVREESEVDAAFERTSSEARSFFADEAVYAELYVEDPRHIEIQVLGDRTGRIVSLGERECSLQRRHQKVVEECPSAAVSPGLRARMGEVAVAAARAVNYVSAGTVEFLLAKDGRFFFLEMNTRIQVEHPVTEMVYGVDLVVEMIRIAQGKPISFSEVPEPRGHAIECRVYAEDPANGFAPSPGVIETLRWASGPGIRLDAGIEEGDRVPLDYDPMLAKLLAWGPDREVARRRMLRALAETRIEGIETSIAFYQTLLSEPAFVSNDLSTQFLDRYVYAPKSEDDGALEEFALVAAALQATGKARRARGPGSTSPSAWRTARPTHGLRD